MTISNLNLNSNFGRRNNLSRSSVANSMNLNRSRSSSILPNRLGNSKFVGARSNNIKPNANYSANLSRNLNNGNVPRSGGQTTQIQYQAAAVQTPAVGLSALTGGITPTVASNTTTVNNTGANFAAVGAEVGKIAFGVLNDLGVIDNLKENGLKAIFGGNSKAIDNAIGSLGGGSGSGGASGVSTMISNLSSANDSASLRSALTAANKQLTNMDSQTGKLDAAAAKAQAAVPTCESNVSEAKTDVTASEGQVSQADQGVKSATQGRDTAQFQMEDAAKKCGEAGKAFSDASAALTKAHDARVDADQAHADAADAKMSAQSDYEQAQATFDSTPRTRTEYDAQGNAKEVPNEPAYSNAEKAKNQAKAKLDEAIQKENDAKKAADEAKKAESEAETKKTEAQTNLDKAEDVDQKAKEDLKAADTNLTKTQETLDQAKEKKGIAKQALDINTKKLEVAQKALDDANGAIKKLKEHIQDMNDLKAAIDKNTPRLDKLEAQEAKAFMKAENKEEKAIASGNETKAGEAKEKKEANRANLNQTFASENLRQDYSEMVQTKHGTYFKGTNPITHDEVYCNSKGEMITSSDFARAKSTAESELNASLQSIDVSQLETGNADGLEIVDGNALNNNEPQVISSNIRGFEADAGSAGPMYASQTRTGTEAGSAGPMYASQTRTGTETGSAGPMYAANTDSSAAPRTDRGPFYYKGS